MMIRSNNTPSPKQAETPRIAVIGCGAIAELYHLPALARHREVCEKSLLVDLDSNRLEKLSKQFGILAYATDYADVVDQIDGAIVAVPPAHHEAITTDLLRRGIHVLCEKPLAETAAEARRMVEASEASAAGLCVNHTRRLFPTNRYIHASIAAGSLGRLRKITYVEGSEYSWPAASGFHFRPGAHGVLADRGIHILDLICWWLGAKPELVSCENDSFGGPEGVAVIRLRHEGCEIELKVSWLTLLTNAFSIDAEHGSYRGRIDQWRGLTALDGTGRQHAKRFKCREQEYFDFGRPMVDNLLAMVRSGAEPLVPGSETIAPVELLEECYEHAQRLNMPWFQTAETS